MDYLKNDNCGGANWPRDNTSWIRFQKGFDECYKRTGRYIVKSIEYCRSVSGCGAWIGGVANTWRTVGDVQATWASVMSNIHANDKMEAAVNGGLCVVELLDARAPALAAMGHGFTAQLLAATHGHSECVRLLLSAGADANAKRTDGATAAPGSARPSSAGPVRGRDHFRPRGLRNHAAGIRRMTSHPYCAVRVRCHSS